VSRRDVKHPPSDEPGAVGKPFRKALAFAVERHGDQHRKGKPHVPYVSHLVAVAAIVLEAGGTETEAVAGLLHDVIEDTADTPEAVAARSEEIRHRFGDRVLEIVRACTDDLDEPGDEPEQPDVMPAKARDASNWCHRKAEYLRHLRAETDPSVLLVSAADKLHNARSLVADLRVDHLAWTVFNASPADQLHYYLALSDTLAAPRVPVAIGHELRATVTEMEALTNVDAASAAWRDAHPDLRPCDGGWST
jgi:(p)ppGpp synthase/HD superfamily hydrolase